ncbi:hypothetical protein WJR50_29345 [Catalinimonas sp. 4WD22]|uniref:hypothetical protein n=1 Tax=Catalinimonas locisalis TaxID=3133978 RepID=UPI0031010E65
MSTKLKYRSYSNDLQKTEKKSVRHSFILVDKHDPDRLLKLGIWAYFFLLIFEGALRKWFLPGLAAPLLIIRDPLAIWLIVLSWKQGLLPRTSYLSVVILIGIISIFTALFFGHGSLVVALYGARILLIHFPFIFVIGSVFSREDVVKIGLITLWIAIPMAVLIGLQFYSPQSAWVNRGVGGDMEGAGFSGALGYFRPSGTFSFTNGNTLFFSFLACYVFYFWLSKDTINRLVLICATVALLASIPLSISRTLFFSVGVSLFFALIAISGKPQYWGKMLLAAISLVVLLVILGQASFFQTATEAFSTRFESASNVEGGLEGTLGERYIGGMLNSILNALDKPFFGYGIGMGTNAGSQLLTGERAFLIAEGEWPRLIGELGPFFGLTFIFIRLGICVEIALASYQKMRRGDFLPWLLLSFGLLNVPQGQWAQPTALGFGVLIGGLMIASLHRQKPISRPSVN